MFYAHLKVQTRLFKVMVNKWTRCFSSILVKVYSKQIDYSFLLFPSFASDFGSKSMQEEHSGLVLGYGLIPIPYTVSLIKTL